MSKVDYQNKVLPFFIYFYFYTLHTIKSQCKNNSLLLLKCHVQTQNQLFTF